MLHQDADNACGHAVNAWVYRCGRTCLPLHVGLHVKEYLGMRYVVGCCLLQVSCCQLVKVPLGDQCCEADLVGVQERLEVLKVRPARGAEYGWIAVYSSSGW